MTYFAALLLSMFITIALIPVFKTVALRMNAAIALPDDRKVHSIPMPQVGGISMALAIVVPIIMWCVKDAFIQSVLISSGVIVLFGVIDDCVNLNYRIKFSSQAIASLIVILYGGLKVQSLGALLPEDVLLPDFIAIPLTVIVIVGVTNAVNLSDGLDGLAGGISLLSYVCIAYLAYQSEEAGIVIISMSMVGAILGFLRFNTYPASIFMGDTGSQLLGFLAIVLALALTQGNTPLSPVLPLLLIGFPVLDTLTVMYERLVSGRPIFKPDKNHIHHKFIRRGLFHTEAVFSIYVLQAIFISAAFIFRFYSDWFLIIVYLSLGMLLFGGFIWADKAGWKRQRYDLLDKVIKGRLREIRDTLLIKIAGRIITGGLPLLMVLSCIMPDRIPPHLSVLAMMLGGGILLAWYLRKNLIPMSIRLSLFMVIPSVMYFSERSPSSWVTEDVFIWYHLLMGIVILFTILTLKYTRRQKGFKVTPLDFLILFIALILPHLTSGQVQTINYGVIAAKIIVMFFGYEVLIGELRENMKWLSLSTLTLLSLIVIKGIF
jgi:UDP-GlcNAc:undecaprenyl-phosphate GlcNAc-1-phosphate transferase